MSQRSWKPENTHLLTPYIMVKDADASLAFYQSAFGFEGTVMMRDSGGKVVHAEIRKGGDLVAMFATEGAFGSPQKSPATSGVPAPISLYVYCEDIDQFIAHARAEGAEVMGEIEDQFWGDRICCVQDLDGYNWTFATQVGDFDPSRMPDGIQADL